MIKVSDVLGDSKKIDIDLSTDFVYSDNYIRNFIKQYNISEDYFVENYKIFYDFYMLRKNQEIFNIKPILAYSQGNVFVEYEETLEDKLKREAKKIGNVVKTAYISKSILTSEFKNVDGNPGKRKLSKEIIDIADNYLKGNEVKGLYIYGKSGIGKTFLMGSLYNYFKSQGKEPAIIFFPELVRKVKEGINEGISTEIVDSIRQQEILIIDDIGAENLTDYVRDEILVPIINYRTDEKLLTFFTSNLDKQTLSVFLASTKEGKDEIKATRLVRRIFDLTNERLF